MSDREIRAAVRCGASDAAAVAAACGAGTGCGGCRPLVEALIGAERRRLPTFEAHQPEAAPAPA